VQAVGVGHHDLAVDLAEFGWLDEALAHHLAAALIVAVIDAAQLDEAVEAVAEVLRDLDGSTVPLTVTELSDRVGAEPGVDLARLLDGLPLDRVAVHRTLDDLLLRVGQTAARSSPREPVPAQDLSPHLAAWDPAVAALIAARAGDNRAYNALDQHLTVNEGSRDWAALARVLRRLITEPPGPGLPPAGMDEIDAAIVARALSALAASDREHGQDQEHGQDRERGQHTEGEEYVVPVALWPAMPLGQLLGDLVAAARGVAGTAASSRRRLDAFAADSPEHRPLSEALERIAAGERGPSLFAALDDPVHRAVVITLLHHLRPRAPIDEDG
jgi:hypothetical protein